MYIPCDVAWPRRGAWGEGGGGGGGSIYLLPDALDAKGFLDFGII